MPPDRFIDGADPSMGLTLSMELMGSMELMELMELMDSI